MDDQATSAEASQPAAAAVKEASPEKKPAEGAFDPRTLIGRVFDGRYELKECIGRGGMGVVYRARQSALGRDVVVKVLPPDFANDADALTRFEREARGMSKLQHPHIVSIYDFGNHEGQTYIVMEYVEGITLRQYLHAHAPLNFSTFGKIALQLLEGIAAAHAMGLVHRDIKPSNIMLSKRDGGQIYVKILDFGLAKLVKGARDVTQEQSLVGSVGFLSPEQILGEKTDQRVDVYALGVLFYYMLAGERPFVSQGDDVAVLYQHVHTPPRPLEERLQAVRPTGHDVPQSVIDLVHSALSKSPAGRPLDATDFLHRFTLCLEGYDISSPHVSGEFGTVSRSGALKPLLPDDTSERFARSRQETPFLQVPPHATPSHVALMTLPPEPSSVSQQSWVTGEHLLTVQRQNRTRNILLGVLGVLVLGIGMAFLLKEPVVQPEPAVSESSTSEPAGTPVPAAEAGVVRGMLVLNVTPPAAAFLDGVLLGQTPISQKVRPGAHQLELRLDGWEVMQREVEIHENTTLQLDLQLTALPEESPKKTAEAAAPPSASKQAARPAPVKSAAVQKSAKAPASQAAQPPGDEKPVAEPAPAPARPTQPARSQPVDDLLPSAPVRTDDDLLLD